MSYSGFFCYDEYSEGVKDILDEEQYKEYAVGLLELGRIGECDISDPLVRGLLVQRVADINATDRRYRRCQKNGALGGRKQVISKEQVIAAITVQKIGNQKELAKYFDCSVRTIARKISAKEIRKIYEDFKEC